MNRSSLPSGAWLLDGFLAPTSACVVWVHDEELPRIGCVRAGATPRGVCFIELAGAGDRLAELSTKHGVTIKRSVAPLRDLFRQLREYVHGGRRRFDIGIDLSGETLFTRQVLQAARRVPFGRTATYGTIARRIGKPGASRAVGGALGRNPIPIIIPCHRIVSSTGLGGFSCGLEMKKKLLKIEGIGK